MHHRDPRGGVPAALAVIAVSLAMLLVVGCSGNAPGPGRPSLPGS